MRVTATRKLPPTVLLLLGLAVEPCHAAVTSFHPAVMLEETRSDNVLYVAGTEGPVSDWTSRLAVDLPLRRVGERGSLELGYRPSYEKYRDLSVLDHAEHRLRLLATTEPGRGSALGFGLGYERTQVQGVTGGLGSSDYFLASRTNRDYYTGEFSWRKQAGARWQWASGLRGARMAYTRISGLGEAAPSGELEDRNEYEFSVSPSRVISRDVHAGLEYRFRRFELAASGNENVHMLGLDVDRTLSRRVSLAVRLGGFRRTLEAPDAVASAGGGVSGGVQGGVTMHGTFRRSYLALSVDRGPSSGGALRGTSTDNTLSLSAGGGEERRWRWQASTRWARREPNAAAAPALTSLGGGGTFEWLPKAIIGLRFGGDYVKQSGGDLAESNGSFTSMTVGLTWYPRGSEDVAGRAH
ncbi:MAG: hypothetical protein LAO51_05665 [Acidobacteriia bacterium]|nr:hypothetical protein [Terriglobia bacterium]